MFGTYYDIQLKETLRHHKQQHIRRVNQRKENFSNTLCSSMSA